MSEYFPKPKSLGANVKLELDLSKYATTRDSKNATGRDTSSLTGLANLKSKVDKTDVDKLKNVPTNSINLKSNAGKLDLDKLVPVPVDLSKLSDVIKNAVVKKDAYNTKMKNIEDKIPDVIVLATNASLNAEINEVKIKIPSITSLDTTAALTNVENKICNVSDLVKKADYDAKISEM